MFALGHLVKLTLKNGTVIRFVENRNLLVYDADHKDLLICKPIKGTTKPASLDSDYKTFHAASPDEQIEVNWHAPSKATCTDLGLIAQINYYIPKGFNSAKEDKEYKHRFGDFGNGNVSKDIVLLPALWYHPKRKHYYIMRRPSNAWHVTDYIRG